MCSCKDERICDNIETAFYTFTKHFSFNWTWYNHPQTFTQYTHTQVRPGFYYVICYVLKSWLIFIFSDNMYWTTPSAVHVRHPADAAGVIWRGSSQHKSRGAFFNQRPRHAYRGQADGPEKPAAWDYYFQRGAPSEQAWSLLLLLLLLTLPLLFT